MKLLLILTHTERFIFQNEYIHLFIATFHAAICCPCMSVAITLAHALFHTHNSEIFKMSFQKSPDSRLILISIWFNDTWTLIVS